MSGFDTSGYVPEYGNEAMVTLWSDLNPFTQGYVEAAFASFREEVAARHYEPLAGAEDGWTISWLDDEGKRVSGAFVWYVSVRGEDGQAMAQAKCDEANRIAYAFSDLAPETRARIMEDCERFTRVCGWFETATNGAGLDLWIGRQAGEWPPVTRGVPDERTFPPLTPYLGDDGKVYLRDAPSPSSDRGGS